ncbi:hypothetical protein Pcinc_024409 [Petrolisthes cinctipes]|uniref:Uncharacterized protein n=1 Tax=Petrolisthes cinctipes TaxID=88211 RepID=A0AAE1FAH0_PETCI|nr:hypothetical protein Pcinc_024409 [Petrolisthes cinctipes]
MRFGKGDKVYKELLVERRGITSSNQSDKMAARESTTAFNDDQLDELCETFNTGRCDKPYVLYTDNNPSRGEDDVFPRLCIVPSTPPPTL